MVLLELRDMLREMSHNNNEEENTKGQNIFKKERKTAKTSGVSKNYVCYFICKTQDKPIWDNPGENEDPFYNLCACRLGYYTISHYQSLVQLSTRLTLTIRACTVMLYTKATFF